MSDSICCFLTCIRFLRRQVRWSGNLISLRIFQFVVIHTVKGFHVVNNAEVNIFLELSCFLDDPVDVGNLISDSSAFSKSSLNIWKFMVHILLKPGLENFEHYFASVWDECYCAVVWTFFGIAFLWDWNENWPFPEKHWENSQLDLTDILQHCIHNNRMNIHSSPVHTQHSPGQIKC